MFYYIATIYTLNKHIQHVQILSEFCIEAYRTI
jgi:hypothetical protein